MSFNDNDVLCGRGGATNNHKGNTIFRELVVKHQPDYLKARKHEKKLIAQSIVDTIRQRGGRFLKRDLQGTWVEITNTKANEKTCQALREGLDVRATKSAASSLMDKKKKKAKAQKEAKNKESSDS